MHWQSASNNHSIGMLVFLGLWAVVNLWCTSINNSAPIHGGNKDPIDCLFLPSGSFSGRPLPHWPPLLLCHFYIIGAAFFSTPSLPLVTVDVARPDWSQGTVAETQCRRCLCSWAVCSNNLKQRGAGWVVPSAIVNGSRVNAGMWIAGVHCGKWLHCHLHRQEPSVRLNRSNCPWDVNILFFSFPFIPNKYFIFIFYFLFFLIDIILHLFKL